MQELQGGTKTSTPILPKGSKAGKAGTASKLVLTMILLLVANDELQYSNTLAVFLFVFFVKNKVSKNKGQEINWQVVDFGMYITVSSVT